MNSPFAVYKLCFKRNLNEVLGNRTAGEHSLVKATIFVWRLGGATLAWYEGWSDFLKNILQSDEAVFHIGGFVGRHNCRYWAGEDPHIASEKCRIGPR